MTKEITLRDHQSRIRDAARSIIMWDKNDLPHDKRSHYFVTPGGGKSLGALLYIEEFLEAEYVDGALWAPPRAALKEQAAEDATKWRREGLINFDMWEYDGEEVILDIDEVAVAATYQGIVANTDGFVKLFNERRMLLILDESQFLRADDKTDKDGKKYKQWKDGMERLIDLAAHVLIMSGTPERANKSEPVLGIVYDDENRPRYLEPYDVRYTMDQALKDDVLVDFEVTHINGSGQWRTIDPEGIDAPELEVAEFSDPEKGKKAAWAAMSRTEFITEQALRVVAAWKKRLDEQEQLILVVKSQKIAKDLRDYLDSERVVARERISLAITDERTSKRACKDFRDRKTNVLITCMTAYVGLDAPAAKYMFFGSPIRSEPWMRQCLARILRYFKDSKLNGDQKAYLWVTDDPPMAKFIKKVLKEKLRALTEKLEGGDAPAPLKLIPEDGKAKSFRITVIRKDGTTHEIGMELSELVRILQKLYPGLPVEVAEQQIKDGVVALPESEVENPVQTKTETPRQEADRLRREIQAAANTIDAIRDWDHGVTNTELFGLFKKPRPEMRAPQLRRVLITVNAWLNDAEQGRDFRRRLAS